MKILNSNYKNKIKIEASIVIVIIAIIIFITAVNIQRENIYAYNIKQNTDYKVYLNSNDFINRDYLDKDNIYISEMVKNINLNFNYNYDATDLTKIKYKYDIIATLYIDYANNNKNLFKKQDYIIKDKFLEINSGNRININETVNIDYNLYNNEVNKFRERYNLQTKSYLKIDFIVKTEIQLKKQENIFEKEAASEISFNLNQPVFEIIEKNYGNESKEISDTGKEIKNINKNAIISSSLLFIIGMSYFIIQMKKSLLSKENVYKIKLKKILKKYSDIIVELENSIDIEKYYIIDVKNLDELIDVEEEIREPILFFKKEEYINVFLIIDNEKIYRYNFLLK